MSTTVKRVALALWRKGGELGLDIGEDDAPDLARAAIAAMQENWDEKTENFPPRLFRNG